MKLAAALIPGLITGLIAGLIAGCGSPPAREHLQVFAAASLLKDTVNRIGDLVDDGLPNQSFKG